MNKIEIISFYPDDKANLKQFIKLPWKIYEKDSNFVSPMKMELIGNKFLGVKGLLTKSHPFHSHSDIKYFLAKKNNIVVGRLACCINHNYNSYHKVSSGSFGFFECIDDNEVAKSLFDKGISWLKTKNITNVIGPLNFSQDESLGLLIDGYEYFPYIQTVYNKRYYQRLIEDYGFKKATDLIAQLMPVKINNKTKNRHDRLNKVIDRIKTTKDITVKPVDLSNKKKFKENILLLREIYNTAWAGNWGIVPITEEEALTAGENLKLIADPGLINFAFVKGKPVGMIISLPDVNKMSWVKNSSLNKYDFVRLLRIIFKRRSVKRVRLWALGILQEYQKIGVDAVLYHESFNNAHKKKYEECEISWLLEDNVLVIRAGESMGAKKYKTWRLYKLAINENN